MPMWMEIHDDKKGDSLNYGIGTAVDPTLDYDYQAEEWVKATHDNPDLIKWILFDDFGVRCAWERELGDLRLPIITNKSDRYAGEYCVTHEDQ